MSGAHKAGVAIERAEKQKALREKQELSEVVELLLAMVDEYAAEINELRRRLSARRESVRSDES